MMISLFVLAFAVSLDGFSVGIVYGLRSIRIPGTAIVIISLCSGSILLASMLLGQYFIRLLPFALAEHIGAIILIGIGLWAIVRFFMTREQESAAINPVTKMDVLRQPLTADRDSSGDISLTEAVLLGTALSLDALGAGIGAAWIGLTPWLTALVVAVCSGLLLFVGLKLGYRYANKVWVNRTAVIPGMILIVIGFLKLFRL